MGDTEVEGPRLAFLEELERTQAALKELRGEDLLQTIRPAATDEPHERVSRPPSPDRFARRGELGRGGMGVVHLAEQLSLGRAVAIKSVREDIRSKRASGSLLLEAMVLGSLEHPNVVPVHDLLEDDNGDPVVVLKRIEGESWLSFIEEPERIKEHGDADPLEFHLGVFTQVCNAIEFAHSRGIIHRDIKPENVMVGRFGEVYVVDWGVAVALEDDGSGRLPLASGVRSIAGTPKYMAPEMLGGVGAQLSRQTDVYLLGGTLFHVLSGHPPHRGETLMEVASSIALGASELPEDAPEALAAICRSALHFDAAERPESVEQVRAAVADYLRRRDAVLLAEEGEARLAELRELAALEPKDAEAHRLRMFNTYSEARLGFRLARRLWAEDPRSRDGLNQATSEMIRFLIQRGDLTSASTLAAQLDAGAIAPELASSLQRARAASETARRRVARLEDIGRNLDPREGRVPRAIAYSLLIGQFVGVELIGHFWRPFESHLGLIGGAALLLSVLAVVATTMRKTLLTTALNRRLFGTLAFAFIGKGVLHLLIWQLGHPPWHGHVMVGLVYGLTTAVAAVMHEPRMIPTAFAFALASVIGAVWPEWRYLVFAASGLFMLANLWGLVRRPHVPGE